MIITKEKLEKDIKELFWQAIQYSWLNKSITNDNYSAAKNIFTKLDNAYYLLWYIDSFSKNNSINTSNDLLAKKGRNDDVLFGKRTMHHFPYICIDRNNPLYLSTVYLSTVQTMVLHKQTVSL